jgi:hypothetical protein
MTPGHFLWIQLNYGKYVRTDGQAFDWWPELPEVRRQQYEAAAQALMEKALESVKPAP